MNNTLLNLIYLGRIAQTILKSALN